MNQCDDSQRLLRLKIIGKRIEESVDITQEVTDFQIVEWHVLLEHSNFDIEINTLNIIRKSIHTFMNLKIFPEIMKSISKKVYHSNDLFRSCIYDTALLIYQNNNLYAQAAKNILIIGLIDPSEENKSKVFRIWKENMNLPDHFTDRFSYILSELYIPKTENHFLGLANYFLISLISNNEKFNDLLFEHPLEDCDFEDYKLQTNWRLQHPSIVPMFAETLQTFDPDATQHYTNLFQLRQTQESMDFAPTQISQDHNMKLLTSLGSSLAFSLTDETTFKNPNSVNLSQRYRQRKRFLEDKKKISREFAHYETKKKIVKTQKRVELAKEREKSVSIYRNYRKGDFPDIQITLSAVLTPLQMLAMVSILCKHYYPSNKFIFWR